MRALLIASTLLSLFSVAAAGTPVKTERVPGAVEAQAKDKPTAGAPQIGYGAEGLPEKVRTMRQKILDAAYSGDVENLLPVMQSNEVPPSLSIHDVGDPVEYLKSQSGDSEGREVLAIITDILESGWAHIGVGTPHEMFVWPYFAEVPLDKLNPRQTVELFKVVTSADVEEMRAAGRYLFYRIGIGPDGTWHYFKTGEE